MHILVATRETQGQRENDFSWAVDGELVRLPFDACATPNCGCTRVMAGLSSSKATTTAMVVDSPIDATAFRTALRDAVSREGWVKPGDPLHEQWIAGLAAMLLDAAASHPAGTVVELPEGTLEPRARQLR